MAGCGYQGPPLPGPVTSFSLPRRCTQALLKHGASVHRTGGTDRDTPLHVAAQRGLDEHASLYLGHGAHVDARNDRGETALSTACGMVRRPEEYGRCLRLCALLLQHGAAADARDEDERSPLHKACGHAPPGLARLLLRHGANPAALDYGGTSPLGRVLQTAACSPHATPQHTLQELLNHGSPTVWPDAFLKVRGGQGTSHTELCHAGTWPAGHLGACSASQTSSVPGTPWGLVKLHTLMPGF